MRQRLLSAARLPFFASYADAAAWVADRAAAIAAVLDRSSGRRVDALALVGGQVEHLVPQSRYGGGYGVVGSVLSGVAVELAAGYTLSEAGACRLFDKSEGEHLDEGGLEFSRVGPICYLPSTTGLAAGDVIYSAEPVFHDWAELNAMLTAAGSGFDVLAELRNRASKGLIGGWRWRDGAIRPDGSIDFTKVTASQGATIGSVTGSVLDLSDSTFVVTGGYVLRIWNTTDGANVADVAAGSWTRSGAGIAAGAAVAAAVAALIAGGKSIRCWVEWLSELSIGEDIVPRLNGTAYFDAGIVCRGRGVINVSFGRTVRDYYASLAYSVYRSSICDSQAALLGAYQNENRHHSGGLVRAAGVDAFKGSIGILDSAAAGSASSDANSAWDPASRLVLYGNAAGATHVYCHAAQSHAGFRAFGLSALTDVPAGICWLALPGAGEDVAITLESALFA